MKFTAHLLGGNWEGETIIQLTIQFTAESISDAEAIANQIADEFNSEVDSIYELAS